LEEDMITPMGQGPVKRLLFGSAGRVAGTVYGTIVVMATITAGSHGAETDPWRLAIVVAVTVLVLWIAHVYSHALAESLERRRRLDRAEFASVAARELAIPAAAIAPIAVLVLGGLDVLREQTALWVALGIGVATLAVEGARYAALERMGRLGMFVSVSLNVCLGLVIVGLKALVAH
jgi:hypothetical protein